jgi:hypothetical protein
MTGTLHNTNLAALIVWSLWWPLVIASAVVLGRVWCRSAPWKWSIRPFPGSAAKGWCRDFSPRAGEPLFFTSSPCSYSSGRSGPTLPGADVGPFSFFCFSRRSSPACSMRKELSARISARSAPGSWACMHCGAVLEWPVSAIPGLARSAGRRMCLGGPGDPAATCPSGLVPSALADNRECLVMHRMRKPCPPGHFRLSLRRPLADFFSGLRLRTVDTGPAAASLRTGSLGSWARNGARPARFSKRGRRRSTPPRFSGEAGQFVQAVILFILYPALLFLNPAAAVRIDSPVFAPGNRRAFGLLILRWRPSATWSRPASASPRVSLITARRSAIPRAWKPPGRSPPEP